MRSGPGQARTILLLHIISVRPSKQPLMVRTFLKVYMELGSYFLFLQEQIKDIIIPSPLPRRNGRPSTLKGMACKPWARVTLAAREGQRVCQERGVSCIKLPSQSR